ncbi:hypothetical protein AB0J63_49130 [Streptosporangium canum]|uniref:hypothetical protein n=1 Tax=Streptosporangium canum TaxID=324952 RepID=UPI0034135076
MFLVVFVVLSALVARHEDVTDKPTLYVGSSPLALAWLCCISAGKAFDKLYPPVEDKEK